jgi:uncharacterized protein with FMN-binding domain
VQPSIRKTVFAGIAGLSLAGTVAGCAPSAQQPAAQETPSTTAETAAPGSSALASSGAGYKDGTYSAEGNYKSPNGTETVGVQLTLASGTVSAVEVTPHPSNPNTKKFQGQFAGGIAEGLRNRSSARASTKSRSPRLLARP